ncbi:MAG: LemA family protein [Deltaproteobacteria bacterium]|nr:LemA family protein [Deltaproteobacteria bacterium]
MAQKKSDDIHEAVKKLYATELGLIAEKPLAVQEKRPGYLAIIKKNIWVNQSRAMKIAAAALFLAIVSAFVYYYNFFVVEYYKTLLEKTQIEAELQRRNDLIPNLVKAVNDYMTFENKIFQHAADVRSALNSLKSIPDIAPSQMSLAASLSKFQAVAENYPDLKASATYQNLMKELSNTETRIASARIRYNTIVNYYNSRLRMFPGIFFGYLMGFQPEKAFESETSAKKVPDVR